MDNELTLWALERAEAERRSNLIPVAYADLPWVRDMRIEAAIDAVLALSLSSFEDLANARHIGEWSARIAAVVSSAPTPAFARRVGVLSC